MEQDPFDSASSAFVRLDDLMGRLLLIAPKAVEPRQGENGEYECVISDVIVLDGKETEQITEIPMTIEDMWVIGQTIVGQVKPKIRKSGMVLGRLAEKQSQKRKHIMTKFLEEPTEADKKIARPIAKKLLEENADPFATAAA